MLGKFFGWAEYIGCPPNVIVGWATAPWVPAPLGVACAICQTASYKATGPDKLAAELFKAGDSTGQNA